ncbi:unnamed protein product [Rotaria magnacalcarata]|uniref:Uncharacterized protein n=1 Tax=Rotaria magnacalcarata TaxID=392030 RepID=A0A816T7M1_9BILA|nr:unnamed protein product [Rotaria magnacalcarata]CAF1489376.1 unnamed protein product [Rotaria magnacalcarata]CAF2052748.1 unnamed protein product [Rotaria magnacalcarata]CAF2076208.1 unnamed protein product [Rotaria magnacalcarata]CAF2093537.1 unnamed protein product [Rotaria magnacalcarata]
MVALLHVSLIGLVLCVFVLVQANPVLETSHDIEEKNSLKNTQQLYELYKIMRTDPRLAAISNKDMILYIYQNFVFGKGHGIDATQVQSQQNRFPQNQSTAEDE